MKVQKFNSRALVKILIQYESTRDMQDIISARDAWISGGKEYKGNFNISITEKDDGVVIETNHHTFRVSGDFVTKEQSI